jgi:hypothetical protein
MNHTATFHKFKDALRHALIHYEDKNVKKGQALRHIAKSLIYVAINGNERDRMAAIKELADRLDGKPTQAITGNDGEPITIVKRIIVQGDANHQKVINGRDTGPVTINQSETEKTIN